MTMTRQEEIARAAKDYHIKQHPNFTYREYVAFIDGAEWADEHPKPVAIPMKDIEDCAKEIITKDWSEQQERLWYMIERNYRAHFLRDACKWLEQHLHHDNVGGFWADATSVEDFINQFKSGCSEIPNNHKKGEQQ